MKKQADSRPLAQLIRARLEALGQTQVWLADQVEVTPQAVQHWMNTGKISSNSARRVALALQVSVDEILSGEVRNAPIGRAMPGYEPDGTRLERVDLRERQLIDWFREASDDGKRLIELAAKGAPRS